MRRKKNKGQQIIEDVERETEQRIDTPVGFAVLFSKVAEAMHGPEPRNVVDEQEAFDIFVPWYETVQGVSRKRAEQEFEKLRGNGYSTEDIIKMAQPKRAGR